MISDGVQKAVDESVKILGEFFLVYAQDKINDAEYLQGLTDWQLNYLLNGYEKNEKYEHCIILKKELNQRKLLWNKQSEKFILEFLHYKIV